MFFKPSVHIMICFHGCVSRVEIFKISYVLICFDELFLKCNAFSLRCVRLHCPSACYVLTCVHVMSSLAVCFDVISWAVVLLHCTHVLHYDRLKLGFDVVYLLIWHDLDMIHSGALWQSTTLIGQLTEFDPCWDSGVWFPRYHINIASYILVA